MRLSNIVLIFVLCVSLANGHIVQNRFFENVGNFLERNSNAYTANECVLQLMDILKSFANYDKWAIECKCRS